MPRSHAPVRFLGVVLLAAFAPAHALAAPTPPLPAAAPAATVARFIVRLRTTPASAAYQPAPDRVAALAAHHGLVVAEARHIVSGMHLLRVTPRPGESAAQTLARLRADPAIEYAEVDARRRPLATPDDTLFTGQWYLQNSEPAAVNAAAAWTLTAGSTGLVIADLDTGVRFDHPDLRSASGQSPAAGLQHDFQRHGLEQWRRARTRRLRSGRLGDGRRCEDLAVLRLHRRATAAGTERRTAGILGAITNNEVGSPA